jgi:hypothetical protein
VASRGPIPTSVSIGSPPGAQAKSRRAKGWHSSNELARSPNSPDRLPGDGWLSCIVARLRATGKLPACSMRQLALKPNSPVAALS